MRANVSRSTQVSLIKCTEFFLDQIIWAMLLTLHLYLYTLTCSTSPERWKSNLSIKISSGNFLLGRPDTWPSQNRSRMSCHFDYGFEKQPWRQSRSQLTSHLSATCFYAASFNLPRFDRNKCCCLSDLLSGQCSILKLADRSAFGFIDRLLLIPNCRKQATLWQCCQWVLTSAACFSQSDNPCGQHCFLQDRFTDLMRAGSRHNRYSNGKRFRLSTDCRLNRAV